MQCRNLKKKETKKWNEIFIYAEKWICTGHTRGSETQRHGCDALAFTQKGLMTSFSLIYFAIFHLCNIVWKSHGICMNLPLAANEMKACACFFILLTSVCCLLIGNRTNKCSRKSNGVTDDMFHFSLFNTINSHCYRKKVKLKIYSLNLVQLNDGLFIR